MSVAVADVGAGDRFSFTLFLALAVHGLLLSISFIAEDPKPASHTMEITLSQFDDDKKPEKADFLAQTNQEGSGSQAEKAQLSSSSPTEIPDIEVKDAMMPVPERTVPVKASTQKKSYVNTTASSKNKTTIIVQKDVQQDEPVAKKRTLMQRSLEIASLEAEYHEQKKSYAKRPRVTRLTAASTEKSADVYYMKAVMKKWEHVGNLNYPKEAKDKLIHGRLRLLVAIWADGSVKEVKVMQSSGYKILDDAAISVVRLASPYTPFPEVIRQETDVVEIIRTWSYQPMGLSTY